MKANVASAPDSKWTRGRSSSLAMLAVAVALIVAGLGFVATSLAGVAAPETPATVLSEPSALLSSGTGMATGYADRTIAADQARVQKAPDDYKAYAELGFA